MGKPLKAKHLKDSTLRASVLSRQGVKINKRSRLGHSGHFGKIVEIPIERKPSKGGEKVVKKKSKFNKFKAGDAKGGSDGKQVEGAEGNEKGEDKKKAGFRLEPEDTNVVDKARTERLPGESFCKFMKRLNSETRDMLVVQAAKDMKVSTKRKDHLKKRKEKKKMDKLAKAEKHMGSDEDEDLHIEEREKLFQLKLKQKEKEFVKFGEQADRPPIIKVDKVWKGLKKDVLTDPRGQYIIGGMPCIPEVSGSECKRREFEMLRKNAIKNYREIVSKKRGDRGFASVGNISVPSA